MNKIYIHSFPLINKSEEKIEVKLVPKLGEK